MERPADMILGINHLQIITTIDLRALKFNSSLSFILYELNPTVSVIQIGVSV